MNDFATGIPHLPCHVWKPPAVRNSQIALEQTKNADLNLTGVLSVLEAAVKTDWRLAKIICKSSAASHWLGEDAFGMMKSNFACHWTVQT